MTPDRSAADALRGARAVIVDRAVAEELRLHPELLARFGPAGRARCEEDAGFHLDVAAAALETGEPAVFARYLGWAAELLEARGLPRDHLRGHVQRLAAQARTALAPAAAEAVAAVLALEPAARTARPPPPAEGTPAADFLQAILLGDGVRAYEVARANLDAAGAGALYEAVVRPALHEVGERWLRDEVSVAREHLATATAQSAVAALYTSLTWPSPGPAVAIVSCVGGERHELGARMVSDLLSLDGWRATFLGADTPTASLRDLVVHMRPRLVALSVTAPFLLGEVIRAVAALRAAAPEVKLLVGGQAIVPLADPAGCLGADACAGSALEAVEQVRPWRT